MGVNRQSFISKYVLMAIYERRTIINLFIFQEQPVNRNNNGNNTGNNEIMSCECRIWDSYSDGYEEFYLLSYNAV
jgi:hypothetical protein